MPALSTLEALVVAALLALLLRPLVVAASGGGRARTLVVRVLWLALPAAAAWAMIDLRELPLEEHEIEHRPIEVAEKGFVSSDACQTCHPWQHATWHRSYHRTMTQVVTPKTVIGDFNDVTLSLDGTSYHLGTDGEEFWVEMGDPPAKRRVVLSTGSHHEQDYWLETAGEDRRLELFPFVHSRREGRWVPFRDVFLSPPGNVAPDYSGLWNRSCMNCHATRPNSRIRAWHDGSEDVHDSTVTEFGIACESCHGPAEEHVRINQNPLRRLWSYATDDGDDSIVNPARLDHERSSQVCGACHGISIKLGSKRIDTAGKRQSLITGFDPDPYIPGDDINESRVWLRPRYFDPSFPDLDEEHHRVIQKRLEEGFDFRGNFWNDGMVRISGREYSAMIESPCFERGEIACRSCHRLHMAADDSRDLSQWANDQLEEEMEGNHACVACHEAYAEEEALVAHTHHRATSDGSQCYNCHMPYTVYGVQKAIRSHQIDVPSVTMSVATGRPNACNQCHLDKTLDWTATHLVDWHDMPQPELKPKHRRLAASVLWAIQGDAGQRALMAWSMGWEPAMEASGSEWMTPILAELLTDPYSSVRFLASRSLRKREGFEDFAYDFVLPGSEQDQSLARAREILEARGDTAPRSSPRAVLKNAEGSFDYGRLRFLAKGRNDRRLTLHE